MEFQTFDLEGNLIWRIYIFWFKFYHICAFGFIFVYGSFCNIGAVIHFGVRIFWSVFYHICACCFLLVCGSFRLDFITFVYVVSFW
jgi:hypothetical protein